MMTFIGLSQFALEILRNRMKNACLLVKTWLIVPADVLTVFEASLFWMFERTCHIFYRFTVVSIQVFSIIFTQNVFLPYTQTKLEEMIKRFEQFHRLGSYQNVRLTNWQFLDSNGPTTSPLTHSTCSSSPSLYRRKCYWAPRYWVVLPLARIGQLRYFIIVLTALVRGCLWLFELLKAKSSYTARAR